MIVLLCQTLLVHLALKYILFPLVLSQVVAALVIKMVLHHIRQLKLVKLLDQLLRMLLHHYLKINPKTMS